MARARNLKPGFFKNELLAECSPLARILFQGLWCESDREGRLEDRPKRLKAEYLAYDNCDADELLDQLAERGFIQRYTVDGVAYIQVETFLKHQNPHIREPESSIPAPCESGASTVPAPGQHQSGPALCSLPFPESPIQEKKGGSTDVDPPPGNVASLKESIPYQAIVDLHNSLMEGLAKVRELTPKRRALIRSAWQASAQRRTLEFWRCLFEEYADDPFSNGTGPYRAPHENWRPTFDYLLRAETITKTFERAMDRVERSQRGAA